MITIANEKLLTLSQAARRLPGRSGKRGIHVSTLYRWVNKGFTGVRLEVIPIGGPLYTSEEALQRFCEARAAQRQPKGTRTNEKRVATATRELAQHGF